MKFEHWFYTVPLRLRSLFGRKQVDQELSAELREHLDLQIEHNLGRGMSYDDARRSALRALGSVALIEQECRDARRVNMIEDFIQDLRYGLRQLRRSPGFAALAILCLTLGIGANAAVFSWLEGILFRPYPLVAHQDRLLALAGTTRDRADHTQVSWPDFLDLQRNCTLIDSFILSKITGTTLSIGERAETTTGSIVSANYFDAIGVRPIMGRGFETGEDSGRDAHPLVVISYQLWQDRFKGDPEIIGKVQRLNSVPHTIIGVAPEEFRGTFVGRAMNFWVPASMEDVFEGGAYKLEDRGARWVEAYASLKPGVTRDQAQQEISAITGRLEQDYPATNLGRGIKLFPLWQTPFNNARTLLPTLEIMVPVVALVLLIACANVGNLLLVRSLARRHEMTVRLAIGAARRRLVKQLLTEGLILSVCAAAGGILVAYWCRHALAPLMSMYLSGQIDWRVLGTSAAICLMATLLIGLVPAFQTRNLDLAGALKAESSGVVGGRGRTWVRSSLVVVQVCLSFVLLVGAALLMQSLLKIRRTSPGFTTSRVQTTRVSLVASGYDATRARVFQDQLFDRLQSLPGVESVASGRMTPLGYGAYDSTSIAVDGYEPQPGEQPIADYNQVSPDYFVTMGIPILSGREFTRADDENSALVAVVNETLAARYWRGQNPVGSRLQMKGRTLRVVGMTADSIYYSMRETPRPFFYVPIRQDFVRSPDLYIRTSQPLAAMHAAMTREVRALDDNLALYEMITLQELVDRSTSSQMVAVTLVAVLGGLALLLASIGLYGVMSYAVSQGTRELGLRIVLGAGASDLLRLVLTRGLALTAAGILIGAAASLLLTRLLSNLLYNISPRDPLAFGSALAVMTITATVACCLPAWRAMRTDPAQALRD